MALEIIHGYSAICSVTSHGFYAHVSTYILTNFCALRNDVIILTRIVKENLYKNELLKRTILSSTLLCIKGGLATIFT